VSFTPPTITASSLTFSSKRGLRAHFDALAAANALTDDQLSLARQSLNCPMVTRASNVIDSYLSGLPVSQAEVNTAILNAATAAALISTLLNELGTLIAADATAITTIADKSPSGQRLGRVFS
jgi:hypothetical protein